MNGLGLPLIKSLWYFFFASLVCAGVWLLFNCLLALLIHFLKSFVSLKGLKLRMCQSFVVTQIQGKEKYLHLGTFIAWIYLALQISFNTILNE